MNVVMVVKSGVTDDARIRRVAAALAEMGLSVTVIGDRPGPNDPIPRVELRFARPARTRPSFLAGDPIRRMARWLLLPTHRRRDDREFASAVAALTDMFLLLLAPGAGDSLQGVKRGIMELADLILVNKADGALAEVARHVVSDHRAALSLVRPHESFWFPRVEACSALTGVGLDSAWDVVDEYFEAAREHLAKKRRAQSASALREEVVRLATARLDGDPERRALMAQLEAELSAGNISLRNAARRGLDGG